MEDRKLTEKESLEVITSMIARTKQRYIGDGRIMVMWGYLVAIVSILVWVMLVTTRQGVWNYLWFAIPVIGGIATPIMSRRQQREAGVKTFYDTVTSQLWTIAGLSEFAALFVCLSIRLFTGVNCWGAMLAYTLIAMPLAEIAQGLLIKEKSITVGGIIGLTVGIVTVCCLAGRITLGANWYMPLFILAFVAMMIVPGHILNHKASQER
ncbi:MAG: hypothetical protein ACI30N_02715 [Muribaculaceae bacterium]